MSAKVIEKPKKIKPLLDFNKLSDADLEKRLDAIHTGVTGNVAFPSPPVDMATFKAAADKYNTLATDAMDGGKKTMSAKRKQREVAIKMATQLGHYVWAASNNDLATFNTSGFLVAQNTKKPPQPLPKAAIKYVDHGANTGQIVVKPAPLKGALSFEMRYAPLSGGGTASSAGAASSGSTASSGTPAPTAPWTFIVLPSSKAATVNNLIPGTTYQFQIRALGRMGYSDWSDPVNFICT